MADARLWKNLIGAVSTLINEGTLKADSDGIKLREMDPSHVVMVDLECPKSLFDEYVCEEPTKLCINFIEMLKFLRHVRSDEVIDLNFDQSNARLNIVLKSKYTRTFSMVTLEPSGEDVPTPKIAFDSMARITTECLRNSIDDASTVSDQILFETSKDKLSLKASGDRGSVSIDVENGSDELLALEVEKPSTAAFSLSYLSEMVKAASNMSDIVTVEFSRDKPLRLSFELPNQGKLQYYLAPRIESSY